MKRRIFKTPQKDRKLKLAKNPTAFRLYQDNVEDVSRMSKADGITESEVLREIVRDWFRIKRIELLGRDQVTDPIRAIYERVLSQQIAPLHDALSQIKMMLTSGQKHPSNSAQLPQPDGSPDIMETLSVIRSLLEQTNQSMSQSAATQQTNFSDLLRVLKILQIIGSETFASTWTTNDLLIRYLVETSLSRQGRESDDIQLEADAERRGLRLEGLQKVLDMEETLGLPENLRLPKAVITTELFADLRSDDSSVF